MARRGVAQSPTRWGVRAVLAVAAGVTGYGAVSHALAFSLRLGAIDRAYALAPWDGRLTALRARKLLGPETGATERAEADRLARRALLQDPTAVAAVTTLGLNAQIRGDMVAARRLSAYAQVLSRRDLQTQLWAIEDAVARGDVTGALRHYDIALRTSKSAPDLLFPVLASASADPVIRSALIRTLAGKPAWGASFIGYAPGGSSDPRVAVKLLSGARRAGVVVPDGVHTALVNALIAASYFDQAWAYYASIHPSADHRVSRDPDFAGNDNPSPFDWAPVNDAGISASIQRGEQGGVFDFATSPSFGGVILRQMQMLPPGIYRLEGRSAQIDQPEASRPYWMLGCLDGRELGRVPLPNSASLSGRFAGRLKVPAGCPVQYLSLVARPSDSVSGVSGQIGRALLRPVK